MRLFSNAFLSEGYFPHIRSREPSSVKMIQLLTQSRDSQTNFNSVHSRPCEPLTMLIAAP